MQQNQHNQIQLMYIMHIHHQIKNVSIISSSTADKLAIQ